MASTDFIEKYKYGLKRIQEDLSDTNIQGCFNNSTDLTHVSSFVGFDEGLFIGEVLESIFDNLGSIIHTYEHKKEEIDPTKVELNNLINLIKEKMPSKNEKTKAEIYDAMVKARSCVTNLQVQFMRERKVRRPQPVESRFER